MLEFGDITRHGDALKAVARAMLQSEHDAEDVCQDVMLTALESSATPRHDVLSWLRGAARNISRTRRRLADRERRTLAELPSRHESSGVDAAMRSEVTLLVARAIHDLPDHYRDVIVMRYFADESPRAIAAALGVSPKTVSNRLHRALGRLRAALERDHGGRMLGALAVVALSGTSRGFTSSLLVGVSSVMKLKIAAAVGVAAVSWASWYAFNLPAAEEDLDEHAAAEAPAADSDGRVIPFRHREDGARAPEPDEPASRRSPAETAEGSTSTPVHGTPTAPLPDPGSLRFSLIDSRTGAALESADVRAMSKDRFVSKSVGSPVSLELTAGDYELAVFASGFEPLRLKCSIDSNEITNLGVVTLSRGTSVLHGVVEVPESVARGEVTAELHGAGRGRCVECEGPDLDGAGDGASARCASCGRGPRETTKSLGDGGEFAFHDLASGDYFLVVKDASRAVLAVRQVILKSDERKWLEIEVRFVDLDVALKGPGDVPFDGIWHEEGRPFSAPLRFYVFTNAVISAAAEVLPTRIIDPQEKLKPREFSAAPTTEELASEAAALEESRAGELALRGGDGYGEASSPERADGVRRPWHELFPKLITPSPELRLKPLQAVRRSSGYYRLAGVSVDSTALLVSCGPFFSEYAALELHTWNGDPVEVTIFERCGAKSDMMIEMQVTSCTACHAMPSHVFK